MREAVNAATSDPTAKLLSTFNFLENWFKDNEFYGCPFMSAAGEYSDQSHPVFQEAKLHKRLMIAYFEDLARAADLNDPQQVAEEINLLHEGATAVAQINGDPATASKAKAVAARLIDYSADDAGN